MFKRTLVSLVFIMSCGRDDASCPPQPLPPASPAGAKTVPATASIVLQWEDAANETHYKIQFRPSTQQAWLLLPDQPANSTSATHTAVEKNVNYFYRVG